MWAPNAKIKLFDADGKSTDLRRPSIRTFRGTVAGDPDSMAFLSLGKGVTGFVITGDRKFVLSSRPRASQSASLERMAWPLARPPTP